MKKTIHSMLFAITLYLFAVASASAEEMPCLDCHDTLKKGKVIHAALDTGCASCHQSPHAKEKGELSLVSPLPDLCFNCHDKEKFNKKVVHAAVGMGCSGCHNSHASDNKKLLKSKLPDICYTCHDKAAFAKKNVHPPVADGDCSSCHSAHASDNPFILNSPVEELCSMCHEKQTSGKHVMANFGLGDSHPVKGKPDPLNPGKNISCRSCHQPHSSNMRTLFTNEAISPANMCLMCHTKIITRP